MAIIGLAKSGKFSSDRTIAEYCTQIWDIKPVPTPLPTKNPKERVVACDEEAYKEFEVKELKEQEIKKVEKSKSPVKNTFI